MSLPVAILAGGLATRLRPLTERIPKSLLEVAGLPFAVHQIKLLRRHGLTRIVFCVGYLGEMLQAELGNGSQWGVSIDYSFDGPRLLGTGGALRQARSLLGSDFWVLYGDSYLECDYAAVEQAFRAEGKLGLMTVVRNDDAWDRSNVLFHDGRIMRYDKQQRTPEMRHIDYGLGAIQARAFDPYPIDQPLDLATVYQDLLKLDQLSGFEVAQRFYEIGSMTGLAETHAYLLQHKDEA